MVYNYQTKGVCSRSIAVEIDDDHIIKSVQFMGGCNGNTQGVARLAEGRKAEDVIASLRGINCNGRGTSCPDQLANAIEAAIG
ncbi:MAG: TIGR03905 family TSCPD domain-containing protein [Oscillospiraceae bacterium]|nr:TIGR03905 family TSCPD domain-containing protein [Oscillospiraceae bacterium]